MKENWEKSIAFVLSWEGGYVNNPDDPGGETNFGISKKAYPDLNIKSLTLEDAKAIYKHDYWDKMNCDNLCYPFDIMAFDTAVNMGISRASTILNNTIDSNWHEYLMFRISRYNDLGKKYPQFLRGWINRVIALWKTIK